MKTLVCVNCAEAPQDCCGEVAATHAFSGIEVTEGATTTRISRPFKAVFNSTDQKVFLLDVYGTSITVLLTETTYGSFAELKQFVNDCKCPKTYPLFEGPTVINSDVWKPSTITLPDPAIGVVELNKKLTIVAGGSTWVIDSVANGFAEIVSDGASGWQIQFPFPQPWASVKMIP